METILRMKINVIICAQFFSNPFSRAVFYTDAIVQYFEGLSTVYYDETNNLNNAQKLLFNRRQKYFSFYPNLFIGNKIFQIYVFNYTISVEDRTIATY